MPRSVISLGLNVLRSCFIKKMFVKRQGCQESDRKRESLVCVIHVHRMKIRISCDKTIPSRCHTFPRTTVCVDMKIMNFYVWVREVGKCLLEILSFECRLGNRDFITFLIFF